MINNDVMRSIRYMLGLGDAKVVEIIHLADPELVIDKDQIPALLKKEDAEGFEPCSDRILAHFLDGLVIYYRGPSEDGPRRVESRISNNLVLKKLRVAFQLKDVDMHQIFQAAGFPLTKPEMTALFRQADHKHFRACGDQILRNFLKGLTLRYRAEA
ncbi:MAG: DUF1456 family protein [Pseudoxanthomonas sp.]